MKTTGQIRMDYHEMRSKADRLDELANEIRNIIRNDLEPARINRGYWTGESGDELRNKIKRLEDNLNKKAKDLETTVNGLRSTADRQYRLEMQLIALVSK